MIATAQAKYRQTEDHDVEATLYPHRIPDKKHIRSLSSGAGLAPAEQSDDFMTPFYVAVDRRRHSRLLYRIQRGVYRIGVFLPFFPLPEKRQTKPVSYTQPPVYRTRYGDMSFRSDNHRVTQFFRVYGGSKKVIRLTLKCKNMYMVPEQERRIVTFYDRQCGEKLFTYEIRNPRADDPSAPLSVTCKVRGGHLSLRITVPQSSGESSREFHTVMTVHRPIHMESGHLYRGHIHGESVHTLESGENGKIYVRLALSSLWDGCPVTKMYLAVKPFSVPVKCRPVLHAAAMRPDAFSFEKADRGTLCPEISGENSDVLLYDLSALLGKNPAAQEIGCALSLSSDDDGNAFMSLHGTYSAYHPMTVILKYRGNENNEAEQNRSYPRFPFPKTKTVIRKEVRRHRT